MNAVTDQGIDGHAAQMYDPSLVRHGVPGYEVTP